MQVDWSITVGNLVSTVFTFVVVLIAIGGFFHALRSSLNITNERMLMLSGRMINVENEVKKLSEILIAMAAQDERALSLTQRVDRMQEESLEWRTWVRERIDRLENDK